MGLCQTVPSHDAEEAARLEKYPTYHRPDLCVISICAAFEAVIPTVLNVLNAYIIYSS